MNQVHVTTVAHTKLAAELLLSLEQLGFSEGPPAGLTQASQEADRQLCRSLRCPGCRRRGMTYRPLHRRTQYAAVAVCPHCHAGEEI